MTGRAATVLVVTALSWATASDARAAIATVPARGVAFVHATAEARDAGRVRPSAPDTIRYTFIIEGQRLSERRAWRENPYTWRYEGDGPPSMSAESITLDDDGLPVLVEISDTGSIRGIERYERAGGRASWSLVTAGDGATADRGEVEVAGPAYYVPLLGWHDWGLLARALLRRPDGMLPLLPGGEARLETMGTRDVEVEGRTRSVTLHAIHGLEVMPVHVWLDGDGATFADGWSVRAGWEPAFPELRAGIEEALAEHHRRLAAELVPPARERPLVIRGARLFDPRTRTVQPGTTIVVEGDRIAAVLAAGDAPPPPAEAEVIDAAGRTVLPGLWDMHAHHGVTAFPLEEAPLHLAAGVTTARNMESPLESILSLQRRIDAGEAVGPRLVLAGFINGAGGWPGGAMVADADEARAAVDRYAERGHVQVKTYRQLPTELVPAVIERAKERGLRVGGYPLEGMTAREMAELGYDEIHGVDAVMAALLPGGDHDAVDDYLADLGSLTPDSDVVRSLIELLATRDVALDALLVGPMAWCVASHRVREVSARLPAPAGRRMLVLSALRPCPPDGTFAALSGVVRAAHEAGVPVLPSAPWAPGFGLHQELEAYVDAGIPPSEALALATLGAARIMGLDGELGSIEPGRIADFIVVEGDPIADIGDVRRVVLVVKDGRVYDPAAIYRALGISPPSSSLPGGNSSGT